MSWGHVGTLALLAVLAIGPLAPADEVSATLIALSSSRPGEHPLQPVLRWARAGLKQIEAIEDYSCTFVKRERVHGELGEYYYMQLKVRHRPLSIYALGLAPEAWRGYESIFVEGRHNNRLLVHVEGPRRNVIGTVSLDPHSTRARPGSKYALTEIGVLNLTQRLIEIGEHDVQYGESEVKIIRGARLNERKCTLLRFVHPVPRKEFRYHLAQVYVDDELNLPVRYEAYDWPKQPAADPPLVEECTYLELKLNNGFTDRDFDVNNPEYRFPR